ncbi:S8 family serine peptidase [Streptomyces sp. NPDC001410]|uniref:S53 family peptidase n=1 Tax=Streptomyces sp. NPDC001410 TaxID=3364574 RepID=UPI0036C48464
MRVRLIKSLVAAAVVLASVVAGSPAAQPRTSAQPVCADPHDPDRAFCQSMVRTDVSATGVLQPRQRPAGYGPQEIQSAYGLPSAAPGGTVAITIAYHDPNLESDLAVYRSQFGLAPCTKANGCLRVINQYGKPTPLPATTDPGWAMEESLDVDAVSAACPQCKILVVEAADNLTGSMLSAVDQAAAQGAKFVANSWAASEYSGEGSLDFHFRNRPGVAFAFASGDTGGQTLYPSASPYVTSVGGTTLSRTSTGRFSESAWSGGGNGCSVFEPKPSFQHDRFCPSKRTTVDVSADANPATGLAVYDTVPLSGRSGWMIVGGTSLAAPLIAGMYALAGTPAAGTYPNSYPYAHPQNFYDIVTGCAGTFCAGTGYDPPTGIGAPRGVGGLR